MELYIFSPSCEDFPEIKGDFLSSAHFWGAKTRVMLEFDQINGWRFQLDDEPNLYHVKWVFPSITKHPFHLSHCLFGVNSSNFFSTKSPVKPSQSPQDPYLRQILPIGKWGVGNGMGNVVGFCSVFSGSLEFPWEVGGGRSGPVGTNCTSPATMSPWAREAFLGSSRGKCNLAAVKQMSEKNTHCIPLSQNLHGIRDDPSESLMSILVPRPVAIRLLDSNCRKHPCCT